jgi:hypothetical protein
MPFTFVFLFTKTQEVKDVTKYKNTSKVKKLVMKNK